MACSPGRSAGLILVTAILNKREEDYLMFSLGQETRRQTGKRFALPCGMQDLHIGSRHIRLTSQALGRSPDPTIHRRNRRPRRVTRPEYQNTSTWRLALMSPFSAGVRGLRFANADVLGASVNRKTGSVIW